MKQTLQEKTEVWKDLQIFIFQEITKALKNMHTSTSTLYEIITQK